jgi:putative endonuclease
MSYFVYIISSLNRTKLTTYVGYTNNLNKRLKLHNNSKGAKFTKGRKWKIIYSEKFSTKKEAMRREYYIKKNRIFRNLIKKEYLKKLKQ